MSGLSVLLFGDSNLRNLGLWCGRQSDAVRLCFNLSTVGVRSVAFHGQGGRRATRGIDDGVFFPEPDIVFLHLGTCDMSDAGVSPSHVASSLGRLARRLLSYGVAHVILGSILPLPSMPALLTKNTATNALLAEYADSSPDISFCRHRGFLFSSLPLFAADGVHLSDMGLSRLFRSVRGAILRACHAALAAQSAAYEYE